MKLIRFVLLTTLFGAVLNGCSSASQNEPLSSLKKGADSLANLIIFGGTTPPPPPPPAKSDNGASLSLYCAPILVAEGGAALQVFASGRIGNPEALINQISFGQMARECNGRPDGSILIKVGIEGRALLGPAGQPGRFEAPVQIKIRQDDTVITTRASRLVIVVPQGDTIGSSVLVEENILVPPTVSNDYFIEVGLGGGAAKPASVKPASARSRKTQ